MVQMNAYYAHDSEVGPVFDIATFSRRKMLTMALAGLVMGIGTGLLAAYCWDPDWMLPEPPQWYAKGHQEAKDLLGQYPLGTQIGAGVAGLVAVFFLAAGGSTMIGALVSHYYLRAGAGGLSLRIQSGFGAEQLDLPWQMIKSLKVVSEKQFGSLSRNAGNLGAYLDIRTHTGKKYYLRLDDFREFGHIIYERLVEAQEMTTEEFEESLV